MSLNGTRSGLAIATICAAAWTSGSAQVIIQGRDGVQRQDQVKTGTGLMSGRVTIAGSGLPAEGVQVMVNGAGLRGTRSVLTDAEGQFVFTDLPSGTYTVRGTMTGYVSGTWGQRAPGRSGTPVVLMEGQQLKNLTFEVAKGSVISGTVVDERGRPSIGTPVRAMRWVIQSGERVLSVAGTSSTDDRGIYRIHSLMSGKYLVLAMPRSTSPEVMTSSGMAVQARMQELQAEGVEQPGRVATLSPPAGPRTGSEPVEGYAPVFFPGTPQVSGAQTITIGVSDERLGVDFGLQRVGLSSITGHVVLPPGQNPASVQLRLVQPEGTAIGVGQPSAQPTQNGEFTFRSVLPGQYILMATATLSQARPELLTTPKAATNFGPSPNAQQRLWARTDIYVNGTEPVIVGLTMQEGVTVSGEVTFNGSLPLPQRLEGILVSLNPLGHPLQSMGVGTWAVNADASGRFTMHGVIPGRYRVSASGAQAWQVKQVVVNGVDVLDFPFHVEPGSPVPNVTIQFGDKSTELKGRLSAADGTPTSDYSVVIFPDDQKYWIPHARRMFSTRPATDGRFAFVGLPPGDYRIAAVTHIETGEWLDPEVLRQLVPTSVSVRLTEGQSVTQDLRVQ